MVVYKDIITGATLLNDSFEINEVDGVAYEVDCKEIQVRSAVEVDVGSNDEPDEDAGVETVYDYLHTFRQYLHPVNPDAFKKNHFLPCIREYTRKVTAKLQENGASQEDITDFQHKASALVSKISSHFSDFDFYFTDVDMSGMLVTVGYREDRTPYVILWKHGLVEEDA